MARACMCACSSVPAGVWRGPSGGVKAPPATYPFSEYAQMATKLGSLPLFMVLILNLNFVRTERTRTRGACRWWACAVRPQAVPVAAALCMLECCLWALLWPGPCLGWCMGSVRAAWNGLRSDALNAGTCKVRCKVRCTQGPAWVHSSRPGAPACPPRVALLRMLA